MKEGQKKEKLNEKVASFPIGEEALEDAAMDEFLRESLRQEADELERQINSDPNLMGVGASDDLFQKIVEELKERGEWEEEEKAEPESNRAEATQEQTEAKPGETEAKSGQTKAKLEQTDARMEQAEAGAVAKVEQEHGTVNDLGDAEIAEKEGSASEGLEVEQIIQKKPEESGQKMELVPEKKMEQGTNLEEIYNLLPEEDRKALELGRMMEKKNEEKKEKRRRRGRVLRRVGTVAAAVVIVFSVSMVSGANRRLVLKMWDTMMGNIGVRIVVNYTDVENSIKSRNSNEYEAIQNISQNLGIAQIYLNYLPNDMEFLDYRIEEDKKRAILFYDYNSAEVSLSIIKNNLDRAVYYQLDGTTGKKIALKTHQDIEVNLSEADSGGEKAYAATFEYEDCSYLLNGVISYDEIKKIVEEIFILKK